MDEDLDHLVSWEEFRLMYQRVRTDKTGLEARKLYARTASFAQL